MIDGANERAHAAAGHAEVAQIFLRFRFAQIDQLAFDLRADHDRFAAEVLPGVIFDRTDVFHRGIRFLALRNRREIGFGDVAGEDGWLGSEQEKFARHDLFVRPTAGR